MLRATNCDSIEKTCFIVSPAFDGTQKKSAFKDVLANSQLQVPAR